MIDKSLFTPQEQHGDYYKGHVVLGSEVLIGTENGVQLRIYVLSDSIIRFRYSTDESFERDFSYAIDPDFKPANVDFEVLDKKDHILILTARLQIKIHKTHLLKAIYNSDGKLINEDEKGFHWEEYYEFGGNIVQMSKKVQPGEAYYGLGDKATTLNVRGKRFVLWGMDEYGYPVEQDPLYKNIPFFLGLHNHSGYGIFFDNTFKSFFDFASERKTVTSFWAEGGEMNYYFIYGPGLDSVVRQYSELTGKPEMPPKWALGYQQSKWSYYPESQIREIADTLREKRLPCDAIYFDIDYMDGFRCFTWDKEKFPDPKGLVSDLKDQGFKSVVIIDPGIKVDYNYDVFKEALAKDYFCRRADGPYMKGKVWPGDCYFPDFTNPAVREWWSGLFDGLIDEVGVDGVWNDMNEPAVFDVPGKSFPNDVRHDYDGNPCSHRKAHNVYGMQMTRATYQGLKKSMKGGKRPLLITRSCFSGIQRYSSVWTGDNIANWDHLWLANVQCQRLSASGISFCGSDVGGFIGHPTGELYVRWIQMATFHPFFRTHSSGDHGDQEPWSFGEDNLKIVRKFLEFRYQLIGYIYTTFYLHSSIGHPMISSLVVYDNLDKECIHREDEFILGENLLVCPIQTSSADSRVLYLPKGFWYNYWTNELESGGKEITAEGKLDSIPLFVAAGSVFPIYPTMQYVGEKPIESVTLKTYFSKIDRVSHLYEDAGDGYDYEQGKYLLFRFVTHGSVKTFSIKSERMGHYSPEFGRFKIELIGLPFKPSEILIDGNPVHFEATDDYFSLDSPYDFNEIMVRA